ncbi:signal peptide peptidase-like 3 [Micractinium conductrix]|uniref:Signal peptide peptidase-like 3 n=1 Tax=Micractinium conductrix TaxID=554055 RepID=A0A2P6V8E8_9CHLO|nr:signal peptide peptidase-like 3 [Micractinium conductrix]|eukprot:PSC70351.1 signal peptide peptidase-like 3 [Micractinium conductrix]
MPGTRRSRAKSLPLPGLLTAALLCSLLASRGAAAAGIVDCYGAVVELAVTRPGEPQPTAFFFGYPAPFGARLNDSASAALPLAAAEPLNACGAVAAAPAPGGAALVQRGNCSFAAKAQAVQAAGYGAMLLFNSEPDECVLMSANRSEAAGLTLLVASLTQAAGDALQQLAAGGASGGGGGGYASVTLRMPAEGPIDWSSVALWLMATGTVIAGGLWAGHTQTGGRESGTPTAKKGAAGGELAAVSISGRAAVGFVFAASGMLLLLFFFLSRWLAMLLVTLFALGAWQACGLVFFSLLQQASSPRWRAAYVRLPWTGLVPANGVLATAAGSALCATWAAFHDEAWSWPLQDLMGICFMLVILKQFSLPNLRVAATLLCLAFVYDVWWVFLQPMITGGPSVMIDVATGGSSREQLPMVLRVPHAPLGTNPAFSLLGLGDVVLPGLLVAFCRRFDLAGRLPAARGYFGPCCAGYGGGLLLTYCALWFSWFGDEGQPALLYLVPCTLGTVALLSASRGQLGALWSADLEGSAGIGGRSGGGGGDGLAGMSEAERLEAGLERLLPSPTGSDPGRP